ncbi:hypothetical protein V8G54_009101 [Vigna mungo]|uniref:Uncharacterized protein n=1 Tax=Vigna mungo TaxID=3915 RepID=A0AAQ3S1S6_VIGMU
MKPRRTAEAAARRPMLPETPTAPLGFDGGEVLLVVEGVPDSDGGEDGVEGVVGVVELAATTLICSFMPPAQCPALGHMKYLFPVADNAILLFPSLWFLMRLLELQLL